MATKDPIAILTGSIGEASIATKAVTSAKLAAPTARPTKAAEKAVTVGAASPCQKVSFTLTGDGVKATYAVKHNLETRLLDVEIQKAEAEEPAEALLHGIIGAAFTFKALSASEVEIKFSTAPSPAEQLFGNITG
jgi:hypothetical protein